MGESPRSASEVNRESRLSLIINACASGFDLSNVELSGAEATVLLRRQSSCILSSLFVREFISGIMATVLLRRQSSCMLRALYCHAVWPRQTLQKPRSQCLLP